MQNRYSRRDAGATPSPFDMLAAAKKVAQSTEIVPADFVEVVDAEPVLDRRGRRRSAANMPGAHRGRPPANKGRDYGPTPPTVAECMAMLRACPPTPYGRRLFAALTLCWQGALRAFEALALVAADLDRESGTIAIRHGKGNKAATITMAQWAWPLLDDWFELRATLPNPTGPVLCVIDPPTSGLAWSYADMRIRFRDIAKTAGVTKRFSPHQLRHGWTAQNFAAGVDVRTLQLHLRHSNLGVTDATPTRNTTGRAT